MNKPAEMTEEQTRHLRDQGGYKLSKTDKEINRLVIKLMTYLEVAEAHGQNPNSFNSTDFFLKKVDEGRSCDVFECCDKTTKKEVAVKIFKDTCKKEDIEREVSMLEEIFLENPFSKFNVKFLKRCEHDGQTCLVFEKMELNLMMCTPGGGFFLRTIRAVAIQLFLALDELKAVNILHADIHPGNIMFVNKEEQPNSIKLIDFGMAIKASDAQPGMDLQTLEYRAPEIFLGLPFTEAIDVWGVGCTLAFLYLGHNLFSASSEDQMVKRIVEFLGQPEDHLLRSGKYTQRYFMEDEAADGPTWRLREPGQQTNSTDQLSCLDDVVNMEKIESYREYEDKMAFVDLLKQLLHVDANQRISARQALKHPFITMDHLINHFEPDSFHHFKSNDVLKKCPALSEYLKDKSANWTPFQEFPVVTTCWDQEGRIILHGSSSSYTVLEKMGEGTYNYVLRCQNNTTKEEVAVKIPKLEYEHKKRTEPELAIMKEINARNPDSNYIIKFFERCEYHGRTCLVFEMLDTSLIEDLFKHGEMTLRSIRPIAKQLFLVLDELKALNIQHYDIHEGNVMFVNKQDQPHRIKLIDFGSASKDKKDLDDAVDEANNEAVDEANNEAVDEAVHEDNDEAVHEDNDEAVHEDNDEAVDEDMHEDNNEAVHEDNDEAVDEDVHEDNDEAVHEDNDEAVDEDNDEAMHEDNDEYVPKPVYICTDMSDVGCILAALYLDRSVRADYFDIKIALGLRDAYELESEESERIHSQMSENNSTDQPSCLEDVVHVNSTDSDAESEDLVHVNSTDSDAEPEDLMADEELEDRKAFADLLKQMMHVDVNQRISPCQALQHPFITMDHLINRFETSDYLDASQAIMNECPVFSTDTVKSSSGCPPDQRSSGSPDGVPVTSSEGVKPTDFTPDVSASSGGPRKLLQRIQSPVKKSDRKLPIVSDENDPDVCPSNGEIPPVSDKDNSEVCLSGGGLHQSFNDEDLTARSSEGVKPTDFTPGVSASSGGLRKLLQRIQRFFHRVKKSDRKLPNVPDENHPDVCLSNGEVPPVSDKDNSEVCLSGGGLRQSFNDEDLTARSSEGVKPTNFTPGVSASSGGLRKLLKRISGVKNYLCCCLPPDVED